MKGPVFLWLMLLVSSLVQADITKYVNDLPPCGLQCILKSISDSVCSANNATCICEDPGLAAATTVCLTQQCTVIESLQVANISKLSCGIEPQSRQSLLMGVAGFGAFAFICGCLRLLARWDLERVWKMDDWLMVVVLIFEVPFCVMGVLSGHYGFGLNIWDVGTENLIKALKVFYVDETFYIAILGLTKISILMFYRRIFPSRNFQRLSLAVLIWVSLFTVLVVLMTIFQCIPIHHNWLGWMGNEPNARCQDLNLQTYVTSAFNIAQDFVILLLPLPWLFRLQVNWRKKVNAVLMFSVGLFICVTSCIRLTKIVAFRATLNPTWDYVDTTFWTALETYMSVLVPNLPALRSWLSHKMPRIFSMETRNATQASYRDSQQRHTYSHGSSSLGKAHTGGAGSSYDDIEAAVAEEEGSYRTETLQLGDKMKGDVHTGISSEPRRGRGDVELADYGIIVVNTEMTVEERAASVHSWEKGVARNMKVDDAV